MVRKLLVPVVFAALALGFSAGAAADRDILRIEGSTTVFSVTKRMARKFQKLHPEVEVVVSGGGSEEGISALVAGRTDIANSSRFINQPELATAFYRRVYPVPFRIADDCILPVVHKSNRVRDLSVEQLRDIYTGRIANWKDVGGADVPIQVISREKTSGTYGVWHDLVLGGEGVVTSQPPQESSEDMVRTVSRNRGAIGYIGLGNLSANVKPLRVNGVMGSIYSVRDGSYHINRPLFMFTRGWPSGPALEFINYATAPDKGQLVIEEMGFVSLYNHKHNH